MNHPPKIVLIGAGSVIFGFGTLAAFMRHEPLSGAEIWLVDINEPALDQMYRLSQMMTDAWGTNMKIHATNDRRAALPGARHVVVSVQVGPREEVWEQDWRIPLRYGIRQPYAENGGPGAFAHTARNLPLLIDIARDMEELCPGAVYYNFTNPVQRLSYAISRYTSVPVIGMCHQLAWGYAMAIAVLADRYHVPIPAGFHVHTDASNMPRFHPVREAAEKYLSIKAAGFNHFSWIYDIRDRQTGEDLYPLLRRRFLKEYRKDFEPLTREMFDIFGLMPTPGDSHLCEYVAWTHDPIKKPWEKYDLKLQSWDGNRERRRQRAEALSQLLAGTRPIDELLTAWSEGLPEIVTAMETNQPHFHEQLNLVNNGCIPNLPADAVVEVPGLVTGMGARGLNVPALPEGIAELCRRELNLGRLVVDAAYHGDRGLALQALLLDPMVNDIDTARCILDDFISEFAPFLPQFHGEWR